MSRNDVKDTLATVNREQEWARELVAQLVESAGAAGAESCDATAGVGSSLHARARDGEIEDLSRSSSRAAGVRVIVGGRLGFATAAEPPKTPEGIRELVRAAISLADVSTASPHNVIPVPSAPMVGVGDPAIARLQLCDPALLEASPEWATERALLMEHRVRSTPGISTVREVGAATSWGAFALATSRGFLGSYASTSAQLSASAVAEDGGGKKQVEGWWDASRTLEGLADPEHIATEAARRALARVGARKVASTRAPVIFDAQTAKGFFGAILSAMNGEAVARRASFLASRLHEVVLAPGVRLWEDPFLPQAFGSRPFDDEGLAVSARDLIDEEGRLLTWLLDARSASELSLAPTGHASRGPAGLPYPSYSNVQVLGGSGDFASIVKDTPRGLWVTSLLGHGPDLVTGEYSRGASGFWIEHGEIVHPVEEITIAGHMRDMMVGLDRVGADLDTRSSLHAPTIRFAELAISGA